MMKYCIFNHKTNECHIMDNPYDFAFYRKNDRFKILISSCESEINQFIKDNKMNDDDLYKSFFDDLNDEQCNALKKTQNNEDLFITGAPGTGKSFIINRIVKLLEYNNKNVALTATTGCAAYNINGITIHSLLALKIFSMDVDKHIDFISKKRKHIVKRIQSIDTMIIEETSMLSDELCNFICNLFKRIRKKDKPFGGCQMIFVGDFFQLPPVSGNFCFMSESWNKLNPKIINLKQNIRQKDDDVFKYILSKIRTGKVSKQIFEYLKSLQSNNNIYHTKLFPINNNVEKINNIEISKLKDGRKFFYYKASLKNIKNDFDASQYDITLYEGAQIIILRNIDLTNGIVNGTRGKVIGLSENCIYVSTINDKIVNVNFHTEFTDNTETQSITYMPIKLAYALSIHKSQGMTIDFLELDLGNNIFEYGQAYTALSRGRTLNNIKITNISREAFKTHPEVVNFYNKNTL